MATIDEWIKAKRAAERAVAKANALAAELMPDMPFREAQRGRTGAVIKLDRAVLQPEILVTHVSDALWRRITERKPVADLYKAEVKRGRLSQDTLDESSVRSRPWLELR